MSKTKVYQLIHPFSFGKREVTELEFRRPKGKELRKLNIGNGELSMNDLINLAGDLCGEPPAFMDEIDAEDVIEIAGMVGDFLGSSQQTGKTA